MGVHRAGTSVTARVLNLLGVYLGPEEALFGPHPQENKKGYFENRRLTRLNELILRQLGGRWDDPPRLPEGWHEDPALDPLRERARELIDDTFGGKPLWGWKDPRNSLTLPFWEAIVPEMRHVICVRNPLDVAASLERRRASVPLEKGFDIWLRYMASSIVNTAGKPRIFVSYEDYFRDRRSQVARLARFIDGSASNPKSHMDEQVEEWLERDLWRERSAIADAIENPDLPLEPKSLYLAVQLAIPLAGAGEGADNAASSGSDEREHALDALARLIAL
jgi:hypothetical protein